MRMLKMPKKATFVINEVVLEEAKAIVETKRFKSLNSFVGKSINHERYILF